MSAGMNNIAPEDLVDLVHQSVVAAITDARPTDPPLPFSPSYAGTYQPARQAATILDGLGKVVKAIAIVGIILALGVAGFAASEGQTTVGLGMGLMFMLAGVVQYVLGVMIQAIGHGLVAVADTAAATREAHVELRRIVEMMRGSGT